MAAAISAGVVSDVAAQGPPPSVNSAFFGGVPDGPATDQPVALSLADAIQRGLTHNLGVLLQEADVTAARGARWRALADLLPDVSARAGKVRQQTNLAAFGFPLPEGVSPLVGPFSVFDYRVYAHQSLFDLHAIQATKAETQALEASRLSYRNARDLVVAVVASQYLQVQASSSRVAAVEAQVETAKALESLANDRKAAGVVAGIDVLRARVQLQAQRQRLSVVRNDLEKQRLVLARVVGLPPGQAFTTAEKMPYAPMAAITLDDALARAHQQRADYQAAQALVRSAEYARRAVIAEHVPSVGLSADYGYIGQTRDDAHSTFAVSAAVRVPLFEGNRLHGRLLQADALLRRRQAELADLGSRLDYDVRAAFLDLKAGQEQVDVAEGTLDLARQQLVQARDRFEAGVAGNIEVVQAQEALATASENQIAALQAHNLAKAALARAMGVAEQMATQFLEGR